ncbi:MAG TPA: class I SAM-dependent methyltransferase [Vicinamibacteria bacterium]|nr:class I SAM-dependent methyltransferase [Vicinamibacteria bacterium]
MLHAVIERLSNYPRLFLFCRGLLESNFTVIRSTIREHIGSSPERRIIDVACGPGAFSDLFDPGSYTGIDLNPNYVRYARAHFQGTFALQDARALDFPQGSFDDALVYGLLHHLDDVDVGRVANSLRRVMRPAARILVIEDVPTESRLNLVGHLLHWVENGHYIRPAESYHALLEPHFRIEEERLFRSGVCDYYLARLTTDERP